MQSDLFSHSLAKMTAIFLAFFSLTYTSAQEYSELWGVDGSNWNPETSLLRDFTLGNGKGVGYMGKGAALPDWPIGVDITDYGAVANDTLSDVEALRNAIDACPDNHAVYIPNGRYIIDDFIVLNRNNFVIRGESRDRAILFFPKHSNEIKVIREDSTPLITFSGGENRGIEDLSMILRDEQRSTGWYRVPEKTKLYTRHWWENGENLIRFGNWEENSWLRNVYIKNGNHPIVIDRSSNITLLDVVLDQYIGRTYENQGDGHMAILLNNGANHCLLHNIWITGRYIHGLCVMGSNHSVFSRFKGDSLITDHHAGGPYNNLYTEFDSGARFAFGGEPNINYETYWGIKSINTNDYLATEKSCKIIGINTIAPTNIGDTWHHETIDPEQLSPANIWLAQMALREDIISPPDRVLTLPSKVAPYQIEPTDDAGVWGGSEKSNTNFGVDTKINLKNSTDNQFDRRAMFKFDLNPLEISEVANATFRFRANTGQSGSHVKLNFFAVSDDSWSEHTITFNNKPPTGNSIATINWSGEKYYEVDITNYVNSELAGDKVVSFQVRPEGSAGYINTKDNSFCPVLVIHTDPATVPPPAQPTGLVATPGNNTVTLDWDDNTENDLATYNVYRSRAPGSGYVIDAMGLITSDYEGGFAPNDEAPYYYVVTAVDTAGTESIVSSEISATPSESHSLSGYALWASTHGISLAADDFDNDGYNNLLEYALDGDPTNSMDRGISPTLTKSGDSLIFTYPKRSDDTNLKYTLQTTIDLRSDSWTNEGYTDAGINVTGGVLDFVSKEIDTTEDQKFFRLKVEQ